MAMQSQFGILFEIFFKIQNYKLTIEYMVQETSKRLKVLKNTDDLLLSVSSRQILHFCFVFYFIFMKSITLIGNLLLAFLIFNFLLFICSNTFLFSPVYLPSQLRYIIMLTKHLPF